jgi:O-antigen/teichoic acid export membrane protein
MSGPLTKSVAHGATWIGISQVFTKGVRFIAMIILARLLLPDDFGVVAMAVIVTAAVQNLFDLGLNQAIIQRKEVTADHLSTSFWIMLALGIIFFIITVFVSPFVGKFFGNDRVGPVLVVSAISFIICPLGCIHGTLLKKRLDFLKLTVADAAGSLAYILVAVIMAFTGFGVWSIVFGGLAYELGYVILRWVLLRWHPSFSFSVSSLKDLWRFGLTVTGTRLLDFLNAQVDSLAIGRFLTAASLGYYNLGLRIVTTPSDNLWGIVTTVSFPAFSMIQGEDKRLRLGFLKSMRFATIIGLPLFIGMAIVGPELIKVVFGQQWIPAILPMQVISITAGFSMLGIGAASLILAKGRPDINLKFSLARLILLVPCLLLGVRLGALGVALGVLALTVVLTPIQQSLAMRFIGLRMKEYLVALWPAIFGSAVMTMVLLALRYLAARLFTLPDIGLLASSVVLGVAVYFTTLKVTRVQTLNEMIELVREMAKPYLRQALVKLGLRRGEAVNIAGGK